MLSGALRCVDTSMANKRGEMVFRPRGLLPRVGGLFTRLKKTAVQEIIYGDIGYHRDSVYGLYVAVFNFTNRSNVEAAGAAFALAGWSSLATVPSRLQPKLKIIWRAYQEPTKAVSSVGYVVHTVNYIQLLPACTTDAPVVNCRVDDCCALWNGMPMPKNNRIGHPGLPGMSRSISNGRITIASRSR